MTIKFNLLKFVYRSFLTGFPLVAYNPFTNNPFHTEFKVKKYSTYVNYELNNYQVEYIDKYIRNKTENLFLDKIKLHENEPEKKHYLSINIYNCTSPLFNLITNKDEITRCEINTYVRNELNETGTLITDYTSNMLSMDPVNVFKYPLKSVFKTKNNIMMCEAQNNNFKFDLMYDINKTREFKMDNELHAYSDKIFYSNGIYDKLYYDSSLTHAKTYVPKCSMLYFRFGDLIFDKPKSIFYFYDDVTFAGSIWANILEK